MNKTFNLEASERFRILVSLFINEFGKMANGLLCSETLVSTPKYRHGSNSENCPPEYHEIKSYQLLCQEILQEQDMRPQTISCKQIYHNFQHQPVKADCDTIILKDDRVLQNLLRNEDRSAAHSQFELFRICFFP